MSREQILEAVAGTLRRDYGKLVTVRDVRRVRRVAGDSWVAALVVPASVGDLPLAEVEVDEAGRLATSPSVEDVVRAVQRGVERASVPVAGLPPTLADEFADMMVDSSVSAGVEEGATTARAVYERAVAKGDRASLRGARDTLPRFLADQDGRGQTLVYMGDVEKRLGETQLAYGYLEAAARDFADRFDIGALESCARAARELLSREAYQVSVVATLLDQNLARLRPLGQLFDAQGLRGLTSDQQELLERSASLRPLAPGEFLVREGDPAQRIFVVKSGLLAVLLETSSGGARLVRCCYPGWLLGESSVLGEKGARCTASLRAERPTEVWAIDAAALSAIMAQNEPLKMRISATKHIHRIDSFFSMHDTLAQLDVAVRDELLGCLHSIQVIDQDSIAVTAGEVPEFACLVARGELAIYEGKAPAATDPVVSTVGSDQFFAVRDALHAIAAGRTAVARRGSTVVFFDAERLRALAQRSSASVVAALERLG